ncbi:carbamoyltransferase [Saccharothrix tamanrassetensis]|uniref:Carbamoyltransferase n=1 Tax=Saccharothrix tamanrassetensis TaxID=1051531 RepID=A0A841CS50_9PSEU|nr:carbamoyltransferase C-terminal domain-containing protein [Saccharothrix tamanrassetensis]MBB5960591.1 carbamoyltransferase [Saccharothrix tamanrassetensis]
MIVLGLSGLPHAQDDHLREHPDAEPEDRRICQGMDSAACLVRDGVIVAAAAEERFTGDKGTGALPVRAIEFCLQEAGIGPDDVDFIAHGFDHDKFRRYFHTTPAYFDRVLSNRTVVDGLTALGWRDVERRFRPVEHHLAHAASAFHPSGFDDALSIVSDGMGEFVSLTVQRCSTSGIEVLHSQGFKASLGLLYSIFTRFLGYTFNSDEYKVMGLSAYGDARRFADFFAGFLRHDGGRVHIGWSHDALGRGGEGYPTAMAFLTKELGVLPRRPGDEVDPVYADVAAALQARFTAVLTEFARHWLDRTGLDALCLSGGSFLNCLANESIARIPGLRALFIPPGASDDGTAVGAALHVAGGLRGGYTPYTGPGYTHGDVAKALTAARDGGAAVEWADLGFTDEYYDRAADDLAADRMIAWFAGRMEFGPRALGNRSILALPNGADIKARLNHVVKMREGFRPFAPAILAEDYAEVFENDPVDPARYMLCTARVREGQASRIDGAVHVDGTARVQIVRREDNEPFWTLLTRVKERTGLGCVINTSFNVKDQPIIASPELAVEGFARMSLDRLYVEGFRVGRSASD